MLSDGWRVVKALLIEWLKCVVIAITTISALIGLVTLIIVMFEWSPFVTLVGGLVFVGIIVAYGVRNSPFDDGHDIW